MLGSFAKKLRILGFDTQYFRDGTDADLLGLARRSGRVVITADRGLVLKAASLRVPSVLAPGESDSRRLNALVAGMRTLGSEMTAGEPLCTRCGGRLTLIDRENLPRSVPRSVIAKHRDFHRCRDCGWLYWKGTHWKRLRSPRRRLPVQGAG